MANVLHMLGITFSPAEIEALVLRGEGRNLSEEYGQSWLTLKQNAIHQKNMIVSNILKMKISSI